MAAMRLSTDQIKKFRRIQRKHNVSVDFIVRNMPAIIKFVQYAVTPHLVIKRKLIRRHNRVFIRHNYLRKLIFDPTLIKRKQIAKRLHSQWSKRLAIYLRRFKMVEFFEDEPTSVEAKIPEKEVSKQLKEQLELLKSGKRTVPLFEEAESIEQRVESAIKGNAQVLTECEMRDSPKHGLNNEQHTQDTCVESVPGDDLTSSTTAESVQTDTCANRESTHEEPITGEKPNSNFLDMLISKVKITTDDNNEANSLSLVSMQPPKQAARLIVKHTFDNEEQENSNSSSDFFGFEDNERILGTSPGMLSTPLVPKRNSNSAFESETLNAYMRENSLELTTTVVNYPMKRPEDGLMSSNSVPPKLDMPAVPEGLQGLRTVAERRTFLQKNRNIKFAIINNVGTIYRELQKQIKGHKINRHAIETLVQGCNSAPLTRQGWKAAAWLLTDEGNYYFQTISVDGKTFRLYGCRGNNKIKCKRSIQNRFDSISSCSEDCMDRLTFRLLRPIRTIEKRSKLDDASQKPAYKACPLSQKILQRSRDDETGLGSLEIMRMPQVELEVFPQLQKPLDDIAKRYLQLILPYQGISREWAEFSVSTLIESQKESMIAANSLMHPIKSYTFKLPYINDREHVLVRRVYNRTETFESGFEKSELSFRREIDRKKSIGEPVDSVAEECADVLTDMMNSVAISCSENSFIKDDPDNIYECGNSDEEIMVETSIKKTVELPYQVAGPQNKKQSRLLMELRRLNATIIDAATSKREQDESICEKEICRLGCVCASLNEGTTIRQHCGKQKCILDCNCKCPGIMRLETDGRTITTEAAFMLRRQATAKLARIEKEFTSTIVLTGSETLLINESQYDKKRRCTKVPKRYGDFVDPDDSDFNDTKSNKKLEPSVAITLPPEPIMVKENIYQRLKHCKVKVKRLRDIKDLAPWCMVHMVYKCFCKGQATLGAPIVIEKQEENSVIANVEESPPAIKSRTLYSFDKEESKADEEILSSDDSDSGSESNFGDHMSGALQTSKERRSQLKEKRGRTPDNNLIGDYMNAKANHCRRVVPIPRNTYLRRNRKRVSYVQLYIADHETDQTRLSLNEHVLRSVYYHKNNQNAAKHGKTDMQAVSSNQNGDEKPFMKREQNCGEKRKLFDSEISTEHCLPKRKMSIQNVSDLDQGESLLRVNRYKNTKKQDTSMEQPSSSTHSSASSPNEQMQIPKISQIFSLNSQTLEMGTDSAAAVAANITQQSSEATTPEEGGTHKALKNVFQVVIKNMNNLVSKKMQDIDMALRRESKAIPTPNEEILCIIRWNNFLEAYIEGYVFLWEVRTLNITFIAATIRNVMPLVVNALSVVNIRTISRDNLPLLGKMLVDEISNPITDGLAVVMQGQKFYWFVKGFLRPDKTRICPKPTPETHPLLTKKINILCQLLINQQVNEHKKRQEAAAMQIASVSQPPTSHQQQEISFPRDNRFSQKVKILPMQRNISDHAAKILEQMVTQAYGVVRTNVSFRKLCQREIQEICPPAKIVTDHHWLVLDLSSDFSHIFIPELKDLLTLDRIHKVMNYATTKARFVKMQFSSRTIFNAYVTPISRRKLYFGPFQERNSTPKLILLQSVDGQMMLREIYESKHNISARPDKTTAFWLIQRRGKLVLDVETEASQSSQERLTEDDVEEIFDDDDISYVPNGSVTSATSQEETRNDSQISSIPTDPLENDDDDDDCVIIENDLHDSSSNYPPATERTNYTITCTNERLKLTVNPNETELPPNVIQEPVKDKFVILANDKPVAANSSTTDKPQSTDDGLQTLSHTTNSIDVDDDDDIGAREAASSFCQIETKIHTIRPKLILPPADISKPSTNLSNNSVPPEVFPLPPEPPVAIKERNIAELITSKTDIPKSENSNSPKHLTTPLKWNKSGITITKVLVDNEGVNTPTSTTLNPGQSMAPGSVKPTSHTATKTTPNQNSCPNHLGLQQTYKSHIVKPGTIRVKNMSQVQNSQADASIRSSTLHNVPKNFIINQPRNVQPGIINSNLITGQQTGATPPGTGLIVRTPKAINSSCINRSLLTGNSLLKPNSPTYTKVRPQTFYSPPMGVPVKVRKISPNQTSAKSVVFPQQPQFRKVYTKAVNVGESHLRSKLQKPTTKQSHVLNASDPLHISEEAASHFTNLPQPKLPNEVKTVRISPQTVEITNTPTSSTALVRLDTNATGSGVKRNYMGTSVISKLQPFKPNPGALVTSINGSCSSSGSDNDSNSATMQAIHIKGIPIELPPIKKYGIMNNSNTTVITPPSTKMIGNVIRKSDELQSSPAPTETTINPPKIKKLLTTGSIHSKGSLLNIPSSSPKSIATDLKSEKSNAANSFHLRNTPPNTKYGYFHANIEGLPRFVVKRINDDFLIKVPNFNGILKLSGLSTVHNYLNQYVSHKCGISNEDVNEIQWTFHTQDRSKMGNMNRQNLTMIKGTPIVQKVFPVKRVIQRRCPPPAILPDSAKPMVETAPKAIELNDHIVLLDDE